MNFTVSLYISENLPYLPETASKKLVHQIAQKPVNTTTGLNRPGCQFKFDFGKVPTRMYNIIAQVNNSISTETVKAEGVIVGYPGKYS